MRKVLCLFCLFVSCNVFADWHPWYISPKEGQMIMSPDLFLETDCAYLKILTITPYSSTNPIIPYNKTFGWWDAEAEDMLTWYEEGSIILQLFTPIDENFNARIKYVAKAD